MFGKGVSHKKRKIDMQKTTKKEMMEYIDELEGKIDEFMELNERMRKEWIADAG